MANIRITYEEVHQVASKIRSHNETLTNLLNEIKVEINKLQEVWTSDTSDTIRFKINNMQKKFTSYQEVIDSYASFLDRAATIHDDGEKDTDRIAGQFIE